MSTVRGGQRLGFEDVALDDVGVLDPIEAGEAVWVAGEAAEVVAAVEEAGGEAAADVAGGAGEEDALCHGGEGRGVGEGEG